MSLSNKIFTTYLTMAQKVMTKQMDIPERELREGTFIATVTAAKDLAPQLRRVTFTAPELAHLQLGGADEYVGVIMPKPGAELSLPDPSIKNVRAAVRKMDNVDLRWYTIRQLRTDVAEIDIDVVTHGTEGPGSTWFLLAAPGMQAGISLTSHLYYPHNGPQLYVADPAAAPALWAILESMSDHSNVHVLLNGAADELDIPSPLPALGSFQQNMAIEDYVANPPVAISDLEYAWLCGESSLATGARRALVAAGVPKTKIMFSGYWKRGVARG